MRLVREGGAFGRKPFREAGPPGVREGEMSGRRHLQGGRAQGGHEERAGRRAECLGRLPSSRPSVAMQVPERALEALPAVVATAADRVRRCLSPILVADVARTPISGGSSPDQSSHFGSRGRPRRKATSRLMGSGRLQFGRSIIADCTWAVAPGATRRRESVK